MKGVNRPRRRPRLLGMLVGGTLLGAAVATELQKPRDQRTWEGRIVGLVPYDLRRPTVARCRERWWNPSEEHLLVPTVFGVGWTVNFARVVADLRAAAAPSPQASPEATE